MTSVLVIDDEPDVLEMLRKVLDSAGFTVTCAAHAKEAMEQLAFSKPDVILTDIYMAGGDGFELMRAMRRAGLGIPIIVISGGSADTHEIAQQLGAKATIGKPIAKEVLIETVNRVVGGDQREMNDGGVDGG